MADATRNPHRSNTQTYAPARGASQPMRTRHFTGSSLCHTIIIMDMIIGFRSLVLLRKIKNKFAIKMRPWSSIYIHVYQFLNKTARCMGNNMIVSIIKDLH